MLSISYKQTTCTSLYVFWCDKTNEEHTHTHTLKKFNSIQRNKSSYRFFVGQQLFPDPEEVFAELSQTFNEALLQFFTEETERETKRASYYLLSQLNCDRISLQTSTTIKGIVFFLLFCGCGGLMCIQKPPQPFKLRRKQQCQGRTENDTLGRDRHCDFHEQRKQLE